MARHEVLDNFSESIKRLKQTSIGIGISDEEFEQMYYESLNSLLRHDTKQEKKQYSNRYYKYVYLGVIIITVLTVAYNYKTIYSHLTCNWQEYIYPVLRLIRKLSIPLISLFPYLTEWYQEPCFIQNPFFTVSDMDCWPCSTVNDVRESSNPRPVYHQHAAPFLYKTDQTEIKMDSIRDMYLNNKQVFDKDAYMIQTNFKFYFKPKDVFENPEIDKNYVYFWKFTNFNSARILRQLIPRPKVVPRFGQSTERFIIIDLTQTLFKVPDTECNYSFLLSLSGTRTVKLMPAEECRHECKSLQVELKESYLIWYNWWYWRPVVQASNGNTTFIAHVGSYC